MNTDYRCLRKENITIINNLDKDLYYYANISSIQIGVYSTAIYEGTSFNTTTIIVDGIMGSQEAMKVLKNIQGVYCAKTAKEAFDIILNNPEKTPTDMSLWTPVNKNLYNKYVKQIINKFTKA